MYNIADTIKRLRKSKGWTQQDLADRAGISKQSILNYETGKTDPTGANIIKLADALGVTGDYLCGIDTPSNVKQSTTQDKLYLIEQIMDADSLTVHKIFKYYELLKKQQGDDQ